MTVIWIILAAIAVYYVVAFVKRKRAGVPTIDAVRQTAAEHRTEGKHSARQALRDEQWGRLAAERAAERERRSSMPTARQRADEVQRLRREHGLSRKEAFAVEKATRETRAS